MSAYEHLLIETKDGIATITLDRAPLNVLNIPMMEELNTALESVLSAGRSVDRGVGRSGELTDDLSAIVLRASGKAFCAGVDVADHTPDKVADMIHLFHGVFRKLAATDALTIARVHGAALGGGCELACFCDIVLAAQRAKFGQPEVQVGVFPPVAACVFPLRVGLHRAVELTALGATISAEEAQRIGLVNHVYLTDAFDARVETYLDDIRKLSRPVVRLAKRATTLASREQMLAQLEQAEQLYLDDLMKLTDAHEGIAAFLEKRAPVWAHR